MQQIRKNVLYNVLLNVSRVLFPFITAPYLSRVLEPDGVGLSDFANYYASFFALVALLGIPTYGVREVAKRRSSPEALQSTVSELFSITFFSSLALTVVYLVSLLVVGQLNENFPIFFIAGVTLYLAPLRTEWYYQGMEQFGYITARSLIIKTLSVICLFLFVRTKSDLIIYVILNALCSIANDLWNFLKMIRSGIRPRITVHGLRPHMRPALLLLASSLAVSVYTMLDTEMLGFMADYEQVGYYGRAANISRMLLMAVTSISIAVIPRVAQSAEVQNYAKVEDIINKSFAVVSFLAIPMSVGLCCIAPAFAPLFYGELFVGTSVPLMIMSFDVLIIGLNNLIAMQGLVGMGHDGLFLKSVLSGSAVNVLMNLLLIPRLGAIGAAIASVAAEFLVLLVSAVYFYRRTPVRIHNFSVLWKGVAGSLLFIPLLILLKHHLAGWPLVIVFVCAGFLLYVGIQFLLRNATIDLFLPVIQDKFRKK